MVLKLAPPAPAYLLLKPFPKSMENAPGTPWANPSHFSMESLLKVLLLRAVALKLLLEDGEAKKS